jgi:translation elongation factor EF-4
MTVAFQLTGTIEKKAQGSMNKQVLDKLKVERERGITGEDPYCLMFSGELAYRARQ